jgi:ferredoxin
MAKFRIEVNRNLCMGAGECVYSAPGVFAMDDEGKSVVRNAAGNIEELRAAVRGCPNFAIAAFLDDKPVN